MFSRVSYCLVTTRSSINVKVVCMFFTVIGHLMIRKSFEKCKLFIFFNKFHCNGYNLKFAINNTFLISLEVIIYIVIFLSFCVAYHCIFLYF